MLDAGVLLDFAARHPQVRGEVEEKIRRELGVTPARYCQLLHRAAATLEGQAHDLRGRARFPSGELANDLHDRLSVEPREVRLDTVQRLI